MSENVTKVLRRGGYAVLAVVAAVGVVLSWKSLYQAAVPTFGPILAAGFPLLVDMLALGASAMYVAGARQGNGRPGWRMTAHSAIAGTVALNALAAPSWTAVPWHVVAPAVWAALVELVGREAMGAWRSEHRVAADRIPARLWLTAPVESARTWLMMARLGATDALQTRSDVGVHAAAREALRLALPGRRGRRVRKVLARQLRAGSLAPGAVLGSIGWTGDHVESITPEQAIRVALQGILTPAVQPGAAPAAPRPPKGTPVPERPAAARKERRTQRPPVKGRTDDELLAEAAEAIADGRLTPAPSSRSLRVLLGIGAVRSRQLADQLAV